MLGAVNETARVTISVNVRKSPEYAALTEQLTQLIEQFQMLSKASNGAALNNVAKAANTVSKGLNQAGSSAKGLADRMEQVDKSVLDSAKTSSAATNQINANNKEAARTAQQYAQAETQAARESAADQKKYTQDQFNFEKAEQKAMAEATKEYNAEQAQYAKAESQAAREAARDQAQVVKQTNAQTIAQARQNAAIFNQEESVKLATAALDAYDKKMKQLSGDSAKALERNTAAVRGLLQEAKTSGQASVNQVANWTNGMNASFKSIDEHNKQMATSVGYRLDQLEKRYDATFRAAFRLQMVGMNIRMFGQQVTTAIKNIMDTFGTFQYTLNRAGATLEIFTQDGDKGAVGLKDLQEGILELSKDSKLLPADDVAEAMYHWAAATGQVIKTNDQLQSNIQALEPLMHAALLTDTDYETTIKGVYSIISQYYNGAIDKAEYVTEQLYYTTQKTAVEFDDLINAFKMVGPIAQANNASFEEMVSIFGQLGDLGIRGTMAGRAIRQLFIQLNKPSKPAQKMLDSIFGGNADSVLKPGGMFIGATAMIKQLADATKKMSEADRNHVLAQITTANELPVLTALVIKQQRAIDGLDDSTKNYLSTSKQAHDYFVKSWNTLSQSWNAVSGTLQRAWEHLRIELGSILANTLSPFVTKMAEVVEQIRLWAKANPQVVEAIGKFAGFVAILSTAAGIVFTVIGSLLALGTAIALIVGAIKPWIPLITGVISVLTGLGIAVIQNMDYISKKFNEAQRIINDAMSSSKDGVKSFGDVFKASFDVVSSIFSTVVRTIANFIPVFASLVAGILEINKVIPVLEAVKTVIVAFVAYKTISGIADLVLKFGALNTVLTTIGRNAGIGGFIGPVKPITQMAAGVTGLKGALTGLLSALGPVGIAIGAISLGVAAYQTNFLGFGDLIDGITKSFRNFKQELKEASDEWGTFGSTVGSKAETVAFHILNVGKAIQSATMGMTLVGGTVTGGQPFVQGQLTTSILGHVFQGSDAQSLENNIQPFVDEYTKNVVTALSKSLSNTNWNLAASDNPTIDQGKFTDSLVKIVNNVDWEKALSLNAGQVQNPNFTGDIVENLFEQMAANGASPQGIQKSADFLQKMFGDIMKGGWNKFINDQTGATTFMDQIISNKQDVQAKLYDPFFKSVNKLLAQGIDENGNLVDPAIMRQLSSMLISTFTDASGNIHESISSDVLDANVSPVVKDFYEKIMSLIQSYDPDTDVQQSASAARDAMIKNMFDALTNDAGLRSSIAKAYKGGTDIHRIAKALSSIFTIKGKDAKAFFSGFLGSRGNSALQQALGTFRDSIDTTITTYMSTHPNAKKGGIAKLINSQLPTVGDLKSIGFSSGDARKIIRKLHKELDPIYESLGITPPWGSKHPKKLKVKGFIMDSLMGAAQGKGNTPPPVKGAPVPPAIQGMIDSSKTALATIPDAAASAGAYAPTSFSTGFDQTSSNAVDDIQTWVDSIKSDMSEIPAASFLFGQNTVTRFKDGLASKMTDQQLGNVNIKYEATQKLVIDVNVHSSDGTASRLTQAQVQQAAIKALSMNAVEHAARTA